MSEKKTWKRDELATDEERIQAEWDIDPMSSFTPYDPIPKPGGGELYTFPYPYSNGELHLGHGFTSVFYDVMARHARLRGVPVTQSFSYHLTGMPIVAAAYRLEKEFEACDAGDMSALTRKSDDGKPTQYSTMLMMGIDEDQIRNFIDPNHWADYFPDVSRKVVRRFGIASDNNKSFITTEKNPYYDAFARWHFQKLFQSKRLVFGKRHSLYSIADGQPCLGHERSEGEDAAPAKFTLIKFRLDLDSNNVCDKINENWNVDSNSDVYLIGLTMRPETLGGLTNVWIDPEHTYHAYRIGFVDSDDLHDPLIETWVMQEKNLLNLQYQWVGPNNPFDSDSEYFEDLGEISGSTFVDSTVVLGDSRVPVWAMDFHKSPIYAEIRDAKKVVDSEGKTIKARSCVNSHLRINTSKGTGIVGSVPSDSPIDYLAYMYKRVYEYQHDTWNSIFEDIEPIIQVSHPDYQGDRVAVDLIEGRKCFTKQNNMVVVTEDDMTYAKEFCYHTSIPNQTMVDGGAAITDTREEIEKDWKDFVSPMLYIYYEPDSKAISRTGDELVVALLDQWFIDYSDPKWKENSISHADTMEFYDEVAKERTYYAINWLQQWPCSRTCGLGTRFPLSIVQQVDPTIETEEECPLIDSLSDSTIYMCMYTIYDMMQEFNASEFTEEVFDYIFLLKNQNDPKFERYSELRDSFLAYYPVDLRVSAKDLINNHLGMCIMNHVAVWDSEFMERYREFTGDNHIKTFGPRAYRINGYITVAKKDKIKRKGRQEGEKMSKSKGNFKTLFQAIDAYAADPLRFTFCSANIGTSDSYFDQDLATRTVEKLHKERGFILSYCRQIAEYDEQNNETTISPDYSNIKNLLTNELARIIESSIEAYDRTDVRTVIHHSYHLLLNLRDTWVKLVGYYDTLRPENRDMMCKFFFTFVTLMYPIIPHFCENIHRKTDYQQMIRKFLALEEDVPLYLDYCYQRIMEITTPENSEELTFRYNFVTYVASEISTTNASYLKRKLGVKSVDVYCAAPGVITNAVDEYCFEIMDRIGLTDKEADKSIVVPMIREIIQQREPETENINKRLGEIIRQYRRIEGMYLQYPNIFDRVRNEISTCEILNRLLLEFLKESEVKCDIHIHESTDERSRISFAQPLIRWDLDK